MLSEYAIGRLAPLILLVLVAVAQAQEPAISSVTVTNGGSLQLNIGGLNLSNGGDVVATLGDFGSLSVEAESSSELLLSAAAPIPPGDYVLTVTTSSGAVKYGLTIGAAGPTAPLGYPMQTNAVDDPITNAFEGTSNTGYGTGALPGDTGVNNSAFGKNALLNNAAGGKNNTASGTTALRDNTTGKSNTASGAFALTKNTIGSNNTASGVNALNSNTTGSSNTASGKRALAANTTGNFNTASGNAALASNSTGDFNTASGTTALRDNTTGKSNTASGAFALTKNTIGSNNTASGVNALNSNTTGNNNIALGMGAGVNLTNGDDNIAIGNTGVAGESATTRIGSAQTRAFMAGIADTDLSAEVTAQVVIKPDGQLGTGATGSGLPTNCPTYSAIRWNSSVWVCEASLTACPAHYVTMMNGAIAWYTANNGDLGEVIYNEARTGNERDQWYLNDETFTGTGPDASDHTSLTITAPKWEGNAQGEMTHLYIRVTKTSYVNGSPVDYDDWDVPLPYMDTRIYSVAQGAACREALRILALSYPATQAP